MFPFEKLTAYQKAKHFHQEVQRWLRGTSDIDRVTVNQLKRAALSVPLNIAEGSGRFTKPDQRNFYVISRSSVFECVAIFDILKGQEQMTSEDFQALYALSDEMSRMLYAMIQRLT
ncbi:MAG: four helix bundle protein [Bacteroidota bacterium]